MNDVTPHEALELYLDHRRGTAADSTVQTHGERLDWFVRWFDTETDYDHLHELDGLDLKRWRSWRFDPEDHSDGYIACVQDALRVYLRFCADIDAVDATLPEKVKSPEADEQRDNEIPADRARPILEYLDRYEYASLPHALVHLLWYSLVRIGGARALDVDDLDADANQLRLRHNPGEDTPLKNDGSSERNIAIRPATTEILQDYIDHHRNDVTDDEGREPLFVMPTGTGRPHLNSLRRVVYAWTRPCETGEECPHDRSPDSCDAAQRKNWAFRCPSSESSHAVRRGAISWHLREETPKGIVSDRADVESDVLDKHYSTLTESEKAEVRRGELPDEL